MYLFYIDESGNLDTESYTRNPQEWAYAITAIGLFEHRWRRFYIPIVRRKLELMNLIRQRTGSNLMDLHRCEVKSTWLRMPGRRQEESFFLSALTPEEMTDLVELYYNQLADLKAVCISVVIDKRELLDYFDQTKLHLKAWELLCERIENYMRECHRKHRAILLVDDVSRQENKSLASKHAIFLNRQTTANVPIKQIIEMPLFVRSELSEGVQLADLCSYNVYRSASYNQPEYTFFRRMLPIYYNSWNTPRNKLDGLKIFPDTSAELINWQNSIRL
jgi:hypothetical protein